MASYDAWLIDLDGTLYRPLGVKVTMAAELVVTGLGSLRILRVFRKNHEKLREEEFESTAGSPFDEQVRRTAKACGVSEELVRATVSTWMVERPGKWIRMWRRGALLHEIQAFRAGGGKTALVSDYPADSKLRALGVRALFDEVVANGEPGGPRALKPSPAGFLAAAERLAVPPNRCLVLGDRQDADGEAARRAEMGFRLVR